MRGLVISNPIEILGDGRLVARGQLDEQELRSSLLFWDKIAYVKNPLIGIGHTDDVKFLIDRKIVETKSIEWQFGPGNANLYLRDYFVAVYRNLDDMQPGTWSLSSEANSINFKDADLNEGRGALVRLHRAVPVPDKDVPLNEILEFKERRKDQLAAFRYHIDEIYRKIANSNDYDFVLASEFGNLEKSLVEYVRVAKESKLRFRLSSIGANLNISAPLGAGLAAYYLGAGPLGVLIAGAATAAISVEVSFSLPDRGTTGTPFQYVKSFHREVF